MSDVLERAAEAALAVQQADELRAALLEERRLIFQAALDAGATVADVAQIAGMTRQRLYKILDGNAKPAPRRRVVPSVQWVDL